MGSLTLRGILRGILLYRKPLKPLRHKELAILATLARYIARVRVCARAKKNKFPSIASALTTTLGVYFFVFSPRKYGKYSKLIAAQGFEGLRHHRKKQPYPARGQA